MISFIIFSLGILSFSLFFILSKNTHLRINIKSGHVWPILIYKELFFAFSALLLVAAYGLDVFEQAILNTKSEDLFKIFSITIYSIFGFIISILISARIFKIPLTDTRLMDTIDDYRLHRFVKASALTGLTLLLLSIFFLGFRHAFISALISGGDLLTIRLSNTYSSQLPSQLGQIINVTWWIIAIYTGYLLFKKNYSQLAIYSVIGTLLASSHGDKAPILQFIIIFILSFLSLNGGNTSGTTIFKIAITYLPTLYFIFFGVVSLQAPELSIENYNVYLLNRLGVGQMSGVFETFSAPMLEGDFFWHIIPGASFFVDYIPYDKFLMMKTEGYNLTEMGVKNSFFISEAYGIGGLTLALISPFIVGFSYGLGSYLLSKFLLCFFGNSVSKIFSFPIYISSAALTGGFSSFPLFKGLILTMACLGFIWITFVMLKIRFNK